jgi:hypothetical protein
LPTMNWDERGQMVCIRGERDSTAAYEKLFSLRRGAIMFSSLFMGGLHCSLHWGRMYRSDD